MADQNYSNHRQFVPPFHYFLLPILLLTLIGSCVNAYRAWMHGHSFGSAALLVVLTMCVMLACLFARMFALKAQDRAIRAEENFRHYLLTGKPLDGKLTIRQIIGLRFASDTEYPALAQRAAAENLSEDDIKKAVKNWNADTYRV